MGRDVHDRLAAPVLGIDGRHVVRRRQRERAVVVEVQRAEARFAKAGRVSQDDLENAFQVAR